MKSIKYIQFETIHSTNSWVKENAASLNQEEITCISATEQTAGRGRFNRKWVSAKGNNIYATLYFCVPKHFPYVGNLSQILSLACIEILESKGFHPQIKWPNDLLIASKKFAGILCETLNFDENIGIVLGIGINVDLPPSLLNTIDQPATSLSELSNQNVEREQLLKTLVELFCKKLEILRKQGFAPFWAAYTEHLFLKDQLIIHHDGHRTLEGTYESINEKGQLVLRLANGELKTLFSGEIMN
jgi:BirA family biotin operon repressor/biotin-[acetyl-CoA-carboxylase] ligase